MFRFGMFPVSCFRSVFRSRSSLVVLARFVRLNGILSWEGFEAIARHFSIFYHHFSNNFQIKSITFLHLQPASTSSLYKI
ncbi:MAG: hypothetical protein D6680_00565 [Cyanobacteria bacterium J007]|nr:MAG: hypothetical protein D6680_00565 [Cyanobacteria bacterium J007]